MSESTKRNATNVVASLLGYAVPLLVNFASTPYLMKSLGEDAFGIQVLVNVVIGYLAMMDLGIGLPLIKYLAEDKAKGDMQSASELLSTTLVLYIGLGALGMLVAFAFSSYLAESFFSIPDHLVNEAESVFQLAAAGFFATLLMGWGRSVAMGLQRYEVAYAISALSSVLGVGVGIFLVYSGFGVAAYVASKVLFLFLAALAYFLIYKLFIPQYKIRLRFSRVALVRIRSYLTYGVIHRGVSGLAGSIDKTLLGVWIGAASVGLYSLPFMLTNAVSYALSFLLGFLFPASSALYATGQHERLRELFLNSSRFLVGVSCMIFLPLFLFGGLFLKLWLGYETGEAVEQTFYLLLLGAFFQVVLTSLPNAVMLGVGKVALFTTYTVVRLIVFTLLCVLLIPKFDMEGAAWAVLLTCLVDVIYFYFVVQRLLKISMLTLLLASYLRPLLVSVCLGGLFMAILPQLSSWLGLSLSVLGVEIVIVTAYYYFNVLKDDEKEEIRNLVKHGLRREAQ